MIFKDIEKIFNPFLKRDLSIFKDCICECIEFSVAHLAFVLLNSVPESLFDDLVCSAIRAGRNRDLVNEFKLIF